MLLRLFRIFELYATLLASFFIRVTFIPGSILHLETPLVFPLVFRTVPLAVLAREPSHVVFRALLVIHRVQDRQTLRVPHVAGLADSDRLPAGAGRIRRQTDKVLRCQVTQAKAAALTLCFRRVVRTCRTGDSTARGGSRGRSQVVPSVQTALQVADQRLPTDNARRGQVWQRVVHSLLRIHILETVPLHVVQELALRGEATATHHARVAQLDLAVLLQLMLGQAGAGWAYLVADVAFVTTTRLVRRVLDPGVRV